MKLYKNKQDNTGIVEHKKGFFEELNNNYYRVFFHVNPNGTEGSSYDNSNWKLGELIDLKNSLDIFIEKITLHNIKREENYD